MKTAFNVWRVLAVVAVVFLIAGGVGWQMGLFHTPGVARPANSLMVLMPYQHAGTWVFDDAAAGLRQEPFVAGIPEMIDEAVKNIPHADQGFRLLFSAQPFPDYTYKLVWRRGDATGNYYFCEQLQKEGWLCPGLFKYFRTAPAELYIKAEAK